MAKSVNKKANRLRTQQYVHKYLHTCVSMYRLLYACLSTYIHHACHTYRVRQTFMLVFVHTYIYTCLLANIISVER